MPKEYDNPDTLFSSVEHGFSQAVVAACTRTVYVSGQTAWDAGKEIVGGSNLADQAFRNLQLAMAAGGTLGRHCVGANPHSRL
ncbi:MAG TPA: hypothetical protein VFV34_23295 [Blastocatellia bacterium]|nr:hypothetical protein [Blastocatellia bacterium]